MRSEDLDNLKKGMQRAFDSHEAVSFLHILPLAEMLKDEPKKAIESIFTTYNQALNEAYTDESGMNPRSFVESIAGGPLETIPWAIYNAVGAVYPYFERELRDDALGQILSMLDRRNYVEVNTNHTPGIKEPLLLSDICITRPLYWPGLKDEKHVWEKYDNFLDLQKEIMDEQGFFKPIITSDFLVAYVLLRNDFTSFSEQYIKSVNPFFLERALRGIVGLRIGRAKTKEKSDKGINRLKEILPKSIHERIDEIRNLHEWVDYTKFP